MVFTSAVAYFVPGDTNGFTDVFVHDRWTGETTRVSLDSLGAQGNANSFTGTISSDGRYVAFVSDANNLVPGDANGVTDVFVHDRLTGQTTRESVHTNGGEANGNNRSPRLSGDGACVAFLSDANSLVFGDTNGVTDVFLRDRIAGITTRVSISSSGVQTNAVSYDPAISADGRCVAYSSAANTLVGSEDEPLMIHAFAHDRASGLTTLVDVNARGERGNRSGGYEPSLSADGRFVAYSSDAKNLVPGDTNANTDVFIHDRQSGDTRRVSVNTLGVEGNFDSFNPELSADGRRVAFLSWANNLVPGDTNGQGDVFLHDLDSGRTRRISISSLGAQASTYSSEPSIAGDGQHVGFMSHASGLVPGDTNSTDDVFVRSAADPIVHLLLIGGCPGSLRTTIWNATPSGTVAILSARTLGGFLKSFPPCAGTQLGIGWPTLQELVTVDFRGRLEFTVNVPSSMCGALVQAVDMSTCTVSSVLAL